MVTQGLGERSHTHISLFVHIMSQLYVADCSLKSKGSRWALSLFLLSETSIEFCHKFTFLRQEDWKWMVVRQSKLVADLLACGIGEPEDLSSIPQQLPICLSSPSS